jgi:pimeloyl-ACP methyl ester carboxylesterase
MSARTLIASLLTVAAVIAPTAGGAAPTKTGHLPINDVDYYYEIHGKGEPLLLLHGGLGSIDMFRPGMLRTLARTREVIAVDLQGHGRTPLGDRPFSLLLMGDDMAALVKRLGRERVDVVGYSFGGGVALRMAVPAAAERAAAGRDLDALLRRWLLCGDEAAAGCGVGADGADDEGDADV